MHQESAFFLEKSRKVNLFSSVTVIVVGIFGNFLMLFVFLQKRFRKNPADVYLLCLALVDTMFLLTHFFEGKYRP